MYLVTSDFGFGTFVKNSVNFMITQISFDAGGYSQMPPLIGLPALIARSP
jgi:hypothetical protein